MTSFGGRCGRGGENRDRGKRRREDGLPTSWLEETTLTEKTEGQGLLLGGGHAPFLGNRKMVAYEEKLGKALLGILGMYVCMARKEGVVGKD